MSTAESWRLGLDLGSNSLGYAAVSYSSEGLPVRILRAGSIIHTGGQDREESYKAAAGGARRSRNRYQQLRKNRKDMDRLLRDSGYPNGKDVISKAVSRLGVADPFDVRAVLADRRISDSETRNLAVSAAVRHMQSRRGQRNSWLSETFVISEADRGYSEQYQQFKRRCSKLSGVDYEELTPSQLIVRTRQVRSDVSTKSLAVDILKELTSSESPKSKKSLEERLSAKRAKLLNDKDRADFDKQARRLNTYLTRQSLRRSDFIRELKVIAEVQGLDESFVKAAASLLIFQEHPSKGVSERVGVDELPLEGKREPRAQRASLTFQQFRIASAVANLRHTNGSELSSSERSNVREFLSTWDDLDESPSWTDVAEHIHVSRLKGHDGLSRPPVNQTLLSVLKSKSAITTFWEDAHTSDDHRQALLDRITNERTLDDTVLVDFRVQQWINTLDETDLLKLDTLKFEPGRAAHSNTTMRKMLEHMIVNNTDEHTARKELFGVPDGWRPSPNPLGTTLGNPTVDANIRLTKRVFDRLVAETGSKPERIVVESTRDITTSISTRSRIHMENTSRRKDKEKLLSEALKAYKNSMSEISDNTRANTMRLIMLKEQNGMCLYCGVDISPSTTEIDHIVPRSHGGGSNRMNLAAVCRGCNHSKGNIPFVSWVGSDTSPLFKATVERIKTMALEGTATSQRKWKKKYTSQLKATECDRPMESLGWAAVEVKNQLSGVIDNPNNVLLVSGRISSTVRKLGNIDTNDAPILLRDPYVASKGKSRVDRRHHAVDAAVLTAIHQRHITVLSERNSLREEALVNMKKSGDGVVFPDVTWDEDGTPRRDSWKNYFGSTAADREAYLSLINGLSALKGMLTDAANAGDIKVTVPVRWAPRTGGIHEEKVRVLDKTYLGGMITAHQISRASTPQLWNALTRLPDYDPNKGLGENADRTIHVNGKVLSAQDNVTFFPGKGGALALRGGYAQASAVHHFRVVTDTKPNGKNKYHVIRVYQFDAAHLHQTGRDVFSTPLDVSTLSMRDAGVVVQQAFHSAQTWKVILPGDELVFTPVQMDRVNQAPMKAMREIFPDEKEYRYRVSWFDGERLYITPTLISLSDMEEAYPKKEGNAVRDYPLDIKNLVTKCRLAISSLHGVRVERSDILGNPRTTGNIVLRDGIF